MHPPAAGGGAHAHTGQSRGGLQAVPHTHGAHLRAGAHGCDHQVVPHPRQQAGGVQAETPVRAAPLRLRHCTQRGGGGAAGSRLEGRAAGRRAAGGAAGRRAAGKRVPAPAGRQALSGRQQQAATLEASKRAPEPAGRQAGSLRTAAGSNCGSQQTSSRTSSQAGRQARRMAAGSSLAANEHRRPQPQPPHLGLEHPCQSLRRAQRQQGGYEVVVRHGTRDKPTAGGASSPWGGYEVVVRHSTRDKPTAGGAFSPWGRV